MRNLKRALSLTLASVMLLGMMVVGSSALSFNDADDITNVTAASVLEDLGIMQGDGSGNFMPDRPVTRAQMAIIICRILYGNKLNVSQFEGTTQYTDVAATEYYTGYINLATQLGIIGGYGDGRFGPNDTVTTAQAALMLSRALGYFKGNEIAQAQDWALAAVAQATKINMFGELKLATNAELARDNVAEMVFNAITATVPVQYNELLGVYYNENQGIIYALNFNYLETLGYKNFDLVYRDDTQDIYGRPARTWGTGTYNTTTSQTTGGTTKDAFLDANGGLLASRVRMLDKDEIITVALTPDYVYTENTDEDEVYKDLGRSLCTEYQGGNNDRGYVWTAYVNGEKVYENGRVISNTYYGYDRSHAGHDHNDIYVPRNDCDADYVMTGKGAQTEIYVDDGDATVTVVEINYYLGEVTRVSDDTITVKTLSTEPNRLNIRTATAAGYEEEDLVVFTVDENEDNDFYICEVFEPQTETGTIRRVESDTSSSDSYVRFEVGGDRYRYSGAGHMVYDLDDLNDPQHPDLEEEYNLYMDPNGYVLAYELAEDETLNYLYVKDSDEEMKDWVARVIYADATVAKVDVKEDLKGVEVTDRNHDNVLMGDTNPGTRYDEVHWFDGAGYEKNTHTNIDGLVWKYTRNNSGVHTLTWTDGNYLNGVDVEKDKAYIGTGYGRVIVDERTVFVDVDNEKTYTGYSAVPTVRNAELIYVLDRKGVADVVFILDGAIYDDGFYFVLEDTNRESWLRGGNGGDRYWHYTKSYVDGVKEDVYVDYTNAGGAQDNLEKGVLYKATRIEEEDGVKYLETVAEVLRFDNVANWTEAAARGGYADSLANMRVNNARHGNAFGLTTTDGEKELQYTTNSDTRFVLVEENYKRNGIDNDGWTISVGRIGDIDVTDYAEKLNNYVTVVQEDGDGLAEIVYILRTNTRYPIVLTDANDSTKKSTFWAEMVAWNDATRTPVAEVNIPASKLGGNVTITNVTGDESNTLHQDAAGNLVGTVTIAANVADKLVIEGTIDTTGKPEQGKVSIKTNAGVTYTVNDDETAYTADQTIDVKDGETVKVVATLKDGYKWTDTAITGKTWTETKKGGETITIPATEKVAQTFKLTLTGTTTVLDAAKVYVNGKEVARNDMNATSTGTEYIWNIKEGETVMIDHAATFTTAGTILLDGVEASVDGTIKRATFTITKDMKVALGSAVSDVMYTVTFNDGIKLVEFKDNNGDKVTPAQVSEDGNTYYVKSSDNVSYIKVDHTGVDTAVAVASDSFTAEYYNNGHVKTTRWWAGGSDNNNIETGGVTENLNVFAAVRVDFDISASRVMFLDQLACWNGSAADADTWETFLVAPDAEYAIGSDADDLAGLIVTARDAANPKTAATAIGGKLKVEKTGIKLWGAYKLYLTGVESVKVESSGEVVKNGEYVVKDTVIDADAGGVNVICVNENGYTDTLANITVDGTHDRIARAAKVTLGEAGSSDKPVIALYVKDADRPSGRSKIGECTDSAAKDLYVAVDASAEYTVESADTTTSGATLTLEGVTATSSGACDGDTGAYAHFKITGYDNITVKQVGP